MKKSIRITSLLLAILMLALPLVGCDRIDEMRANQGFWNDDGSISFNGETYKLLSPSTYLYLIINPYYKLEITDKNVPVLLSEEYGIDARMTFDKMFIRALVGDRYNVYCREDKYDYVEQSIKQHENMNYLGFYYPYEYISISRKVEYFDNGGKPVQLLTEEEIAALKEITSVEGTSFSDKEYELITEYGRVVIYYCSEDMLFRKESGIVFFLDPSRCRYIVDGDSVYSVPEEYDDLFDDMFEEYRKINIGIF